MKTWIQTSALFGILALASGCGQGDAAPVDQKTHSLVGRPTLAPQVPQNFGRTTGGGHSALAPVTRPKPPAQTEEAKPKPTEEKQSDAAETKKPAGDTLTQKDDKSGKRDDSRRGRGTGSRGSYGMYGSGRDNSGDRERSKKDGGEWFRKEGGTAKNEGNKDSPRTGGDPVVFEDGGEERPRGMTGLSGNVGGGLGGPGGGARTTLKRPKLPSNAPDWFLKYDKDGEGQIFMHQWPREDLTSFYKYDTNGDGIITIEEAMRTVKGAPPAAPATTASNDKPATPATPGGPPPSNPLPGTGAGGLAMTGGGNGNNDENLLRMAEGTIRRYDRNNDGMLDEQELQGTMMLRNNWQQWDTNKDGKLDKNEIVAAFKSMNMGGMGGGFGGRGMGGERGDRFGGGGDRFGGGGDRFGGGRGGDRGNRGGGDMTERAARFMRQFDRNGDGKLSQDEFPTFLRKDRFTEYDKNKDGFIDVDELKAIFENMGQGGGGMGGRGMGGGNMGGGGEFRRRDR
jgi:Ca2+-binding EF-hand superfamily protein